MIVTRKEDIKMPTVRPTKRRLKEIVSESKRTVVKEVNDRRRTAVLEHSLKFWEGYDPDFKLLKEMFEADLIHTAKYNAIVENYNHIREDLGDFYMGSYSYNRYSIENFEEFKQNFVISFHDRYVPKLESVKAPFDAEINEIRTAYQGVLSNLDTMTPKKGLEYLNGLEFDVSEFEEEEVLPPLVQVDKDALKTPLENKAPAV